MSARSTPTKFKKLAIANRGEVAVRIIRACQELGITSVLLHSDVDEATEAYRLADERVCIGTGPSSDSYLNIQKNVNGALAAEADALHPGFGFLSENADFVDACEKKNIVFVGPSAKSIRLFGDKISAKKLAHQLGVNTIPGYQGEDQSDQGLMSEAAKIGYPVLVKAAHGGGGRGQKVIRDKASAQEMIQSARREAQSAFGNSELFLEKYLDKAKHIEVQIFGDSRGKIYALGERECTVQRRHQKIIEESPSAKLDESLRGRIVASAVKIAESAKYQNAGTVEFLVQDGEIYFLEMNTRLQVEHPVTEMVLNVDLVKAQIFTAQGMPVLWDQDFLVPRGHAIEARLVAEDPYQNGMPSIGKILGTHFPGGAGRRFEVGFTAGDEVTSNYDSMIAKIIVWDESRPRAIAKLIRTLKDTVIFGLKTNIPYLLEILEHPEFVAGTMNTQFISTCFPEGLEKKELSSRETEIIELIKAKLPNSNVKGSFQGVNPWFT